jgi:glycerate kinase
VHPEPVGEGVQRAARAAREAGAVEEDARAVDGAGAPGGLALELVELGDALLAPSTACCHPFFFSARATRSTRCSSCSSA